MPWGISASKTASCKLHPPSRKPDLCPSKSRTTSLSLAAESRSIELIVRICVPCVFVPLLFCGWVEWMWKYLICCMWSLIGHGKGESKVALEFSGHFTRGFENHGWSLPCLLGIWRKLAHLLVSSALFFLCFEMVLYCSSTCFGMKTFKGHPQYGSRRYWLLHQAKHFAPDWWLPCRHHS